MEKQNTEGYAVVAGHISLDITPNFQTGEYKPLFEILSPGKLINISGVRLATGGAVSNTGIALKILGIPTQLMGKIGNDPFGEIVLKIMREWDADKAMSVVDGIQTSFTVVIVPPKIDRIFLHDPGANHTFGMEDIDFDIVKDAKIFHFGYPTVMRRMYMDTGAEIIKIFKKVKEMGVATSLDMCVPDPKSEAGRVDWTKLLEGLLPYVDIYAPSIEETLFMLDPHEYNRMNDTLKGRDMMDVLDINILQKMGEKIIEMGSKIVVLKCGKKGCYIRTQDKSVLKGMGSAVPAKLDNWGSRELFEEAYHAPIVLSATGAGDTCIAGFIGAFLRGYDLEDTIKIACATGSECVQTYDSLSGLKPLEETVSMIKNGWEKDKVSIEGAYWKYNGEIKSWVGLKDSTR